MPRLAGDFDVVVVFHHRCSRCAAAPSHRPRECVHDPSVRYYEWGQRYFLAAMPRNDRGRDLVAALPSDRLLTETDAPFTQVGSRPTAPIDVKETVEALAALRNVTPKDLTQNIGSNLRTLLDGAGVTTDP